MGLELWQSTRPGSSLKTLSAVQGKVRWQATLISKLSDTVKLVGPTISCEGSPKDGIVDGEWRTNPHVQSYVVATDQARPDSLWHAPALCRWVHQYLLSCPAAGSMNSMLAALAAQTSGMSSDTPLKGQSSLDHLCPGQAFMVSVLSAHWCNSLLSAFCQLSSLLAAPQCFTPAGVVCWLCLTPYTHPQTGFCQRWLGAPFRPSSWSVVTALVQSQHQAIGARSPRLPLRVGFACAPHLTQA